MGWLDRLFGKKEETETVARTPSGPKPFEGIEGIRIGRYSDNNKSQARTERWYEAEAFFKEKNYPEAIKALMDYLRDEEEDNLHYQTGEKGCSFELFQGSKRIYGECDGQNFLARVQLAVMEKPGTAIMRRLLELNYNLYYSRTAFDGQQTLYMLFETTLASANASKIFYGLRELATRADRQDDLLLADFSVLKPVDSAHVKPVPAAEVSVKYRYFRQWIEQTLKETAVLNTDSFAGAIAYMLLGLIYRIDFLIVPVGPLLKSLEAINAIYWEKKDELALVERNARMTEAIRKLLDLSEAEFAASLHRSRSTFSITSPPRQDKMKDNVHNANKDARWYIDNQYPAVALRLVEYGILYNQFAYSMPRVHTCLTTILMAVLHAEYFKELGLKHAFYHPESETFERELIGRAADEATARFRDKYTQMHWEHSRISYENRFEFASSFTDQMMSLNLETKRQPA